MITTKVELLSLGSGQEGSCKENTGRLKLELAKEKQPREEYSTVLLPGRKKSRAQWGLHCSMLFREKAKCAEERELQERQSTGGYNLLIKMCALTEKEPKLLAASAHKGGLKWKEAEASTADADDHNGCG